MKFFLILLCSSLTTFAQSTDKYKLEEERLDTTYTRIDSILILGVGPVTSAIFLDNLSEKLIQSLNKGKITAEYVYLGKNAAAIREEFDKIKLENYKSILLFMPHDSSFFETKIPKAAIPMMVPGARITGGSKARRYNYEGSFDVTLYNNKEKIKAIWSAYLETDINLANKAAGTNISNKIIKSFARHMFIR